MRSSKHFCLRLAMNSCNALVTAAFFVRSPLTSSARSISSGSMERLVAMCEPPHISLHICSHKSNRAMGGGRYVATGRLRRPDRDQDSAPEAVTDDHDHVVLIR